MSECRAFSVVPFVALAARDDGDDFILAVEAVFSARPHTSTADRDAMIPSLLAAPLSRVRPKAALSNDLLTSAS